MKKLTSILLVVILTLACTMSVLAAKVYYPSDWAEEASDELELTWYESPKRNVQKGEFMFTFLRMIQASHERLDDELLESDTDLDFYDADELTDEEQAEASILVDLGVLNGYRGYMNMGNDIKRSEAAKVLTFFNSELDLDYIRKSITFADCIDHWAEDSIKTAYRLGLVNGSGRNSEGFAIFNPDDNLTVEEMVQILYNISDVNDDFTYEDIAKALTTVFEVETDLDIESEYETGTYALYLNVGDKITYTTDTDGVWTSSNRSSVTVTSQGVITAKSQGKATISHGDISFTVFVGQDTVYLEVGDTKKISKLNSSSWKSSNKKVATVDRYGKVTGVAKGTATISLDDEAYKVTVVDGTIITLNVGETEKLGGSKWTSSNKAVATVTSSGVVKAISSGVTVISNKYSEYYVVVPGTSELEMNVGDKFKFDSTSTWKSSNSKIVSVSGGYIKAVSEGTATVSSDDMIIEITVTDEYTSSSIKKYITLEVGDTYSLGTKYADWYSSNSKVASVSDYGKVTAKKVGTTIITNDDTGYSYYITVVDDDDDDDDNCNNDNDYSSGYDKDILVYAEGFEPNSYYNAFVGDTVKIIVYSADSKLKSVDLSNSKCTLEKEVSSLGNNKYTFTVSAESAGACVLTLNFNDGNHTEFTINAFKD